MRNKSAYFVFTCFVFLLFLVSPALASRARHYFLHSGPGIKFGVIGKVRAGEAIRVLKEGAGWIKIQTSKGKTGWISQRVYQRGWRGYNGRKAHRRFKVDIKFQNIPKECVNIMKAKLGDLQRRLSPVGDNDLELIISALPRLHSFRMFLIIDFNTRFYRRVRKRFALPTTIDLLPYNNCIWALYAYKQDLIRAAHERHPSCDFISRFDICLVLRKLNGEEIILETSEDGVYIYFSPFIILKMPDGRSLRVMSQEPKKVGLLSAFVLPYPLEKGDPNTAKAYEVYRFFREHP